MGNSASSEEFRPEQHRISKSQPVDASRDDVQDPITQKATVFDCPLPVLPPLASSPLSIIDPTTMTYLEGIGGSFSDEATKPATSNQSSGLGKVTSSQPRPSSSTSKSKARQCDGKLSVGLSIAVASAQSALDKLAASSPTLRFASQAFTSTIKGYTNSITVIEASELLPQPVTNVLAKITP